jgi:hypothetical protein
MLSAPGLRCSNPKVLCARIRCDEKIKTPAARRDRGLLT